MKTVNNEFIKKLDAIKFSITGNDIPQQSVLLDRLNELTGMIEEGDFIDFYHEGFDTLKLMIKAKLALKKAAPDSDAFLHISSSVKGLRNLINEADEVIGGILRAEGLSDALLRAGPFILIAAVVVIGAFLFSHFFH
ncbi:hypothetical protein FOT62_21505 [Serratia marcescens]|uniref:Uncharacterized protein n=1 Tax=Serratia marcescens TaxID=615 RepID=A0A5C7BZD6_SERMA|nr:hypothetical protein [Serratia marcescens]TXE28344.1 hypothetical protein FOT62_21505 [Serratia marcescens]TXE56848.1 hypothetical protein FOT56_23550 [Serratia marcescens]